MRLTTKKRKIEVVSYNPSWSSQYQEEADKISSLLSDLILSIHHIGSTAISSSIF
jgi:GrpB-like predicted nucleotidyltransferase (UPF0157 family)